MCCNVAAARKMLTRLEHVDTILVSWQHVNIKYLAQALGAPKEVVPEWRALGLDLGRSRAMASCSTAHTSHDTHLPVHGRRPNSDFDRIYVLNYDADGNYQVRSSG